MRSALQVGLFVRRRLSGARRRLVLPHVSIDVMNPHLREISSQVSHDAFAELALDGAGWHQLGDRLTVPDSIGRLNLPS
jgi:hypothetical protein